MLQQLFSKFERSLEKLVNALEWELISCPVRRWPGEVKKTLEKDDGIIEKLVNAVPDFLAEMRPYNLDRF
jgi:hypothetical protein